MEKGMGFVVEWKIVVDVLLKGQISCTNAMYP